MADEISNRDRKPFILIATLMALAGSLVAILVKRRRDVRTRKPLHEQYLGADRPVHHIRGLSEAEAAARLQEDQDNSLSFKPRRTRREIWRQNVLSIFNLSLIGLAAVQILFGRPLDALISMGVLGLNIGVNVFQEYFARMRIKDILEATKPKVTVIREGTAGSIDADDIVVGDVVAFGPGDELLADGILLDQEGLVIDDSMLGDGDRRSYKEIGEPVFAGSFCVSGRAVYQVDKIGRDRLVTSLIENSEISKEQLTPIEQIVGNVLKGLLVIVVIFTLFLLNSYFKLDLPIPDEIFNEVAGVIFSLAPAGLFFMIIVTYAASTVDLANVGALVNRIRSIEALAQVNTICFSKEGVLTGMRIEMETIIPKGEGEGIAEDRIQQLLGDYIRSTTIDNQITRAIWNIYEGSQREIVEEAPYLSILGWNAVSFNDPDMRGVYVLGVPAALDPFLSQEGGKDVDLSDDQPGRVRKLFSRVGGIFRRSGDNESDGSNPPNQDEEAASQVIKERSPSTEMEESSSNDDNEEKPGLFRRFIKRVASITQSDDVGSQSIAEQKPADEQQVELFFAYHPDPIPLVDQDGRPQFPVPLIPLAKLTFVEQVNPEAVKTIKKFFQNRIDIKIFAARHPQEISGILQGIGLGDLATKLVSGTELANMKAKETALAARENSIFLHLSPQQMGQVVDDLRASGQYVAVVGDSVNDVAAMRRGNLAISYQRSSQAARSVADIILLKDSPQVLEGVLDKGQRIVNGLLDILKLYLTQIFYLAVLITGVIVIGFGFPFRGIQLTVITTATITIPALGLTLFAHSGVLYGKSLRKSLTHFIAPAAITMGIAGTLAFFYFQNSGGDNDYAHLGVTYTLVYFGLLLVIFLRPPHKFLAGGAPVSRDWRIFWMAVILGVLFILTVAIAVAVPFLQTTLMLDWLNSTRDFLAVGLFVLVWGISLLVVWRIWRLEGIFSETETQTTEIQNKEDLGRLADGLAEPTPSQGDPPPIEVRENI
jgi:magnesium-transporting ATPase (P-type)